MRILLAAHAFFPHDKAGTETVTKFVAHHLQDEGHEVAVIAPKVAENDGARHAGIEIERYEGLTIYRVSVSRSGDGFALQYLNLLKNPSLDAIYRDLMKLFRPDVLHCFHLMRISGSLVEAAKDWGAKVVFTPTDFWAVCPTYQLLNWKGEACVEHTFEDCRRCHIAEELGSEATMEDKIRAMENSFESSQGHWRVAESVFAERERYISKLFSLFDLVVPANDFMKQTLVARGLISNDSPVLPFGAPSRNVNRLPARKRRSEKIIVGFCGTIRYSKGLHILIDAISKCENGHNLEVHIYGVIHEKGYFDSLEKQFSKMPNVKFLKTFAPSRTEEILSGFDVLVIPSVWHENTPLIAYSALAAGTPLLASETYGLKDVVQTYRGGRVFPTGDANALAAYLTALSSDPTLAEAWKKEIRPVAMSEGYAKGLLSLYQRASEKSKAGMTFSKRVPENHSARI